MRAHPDRAGHPVAFWGSCAVLGSSWVFILREQVANMAPRWPLNDPQSAQETAKSGQRSTKLFFSHTEHGYLSSSHLRIVRFAEANERGKHGAHGCKKSASGHLGPPLVLLWALLDISWALWGAAWWLKWRKMVLLKPFWKILFLCLAQLGGPLGPMSLRIVRFCEANERGTHGTHGCKKSASDNFRLPLVLLWALLDISCALWGPAWYFKWRKMVLLRPFWNIFFSVWRRWGAHLRR